MIRLADRHEATVAAFDHAPVVHNRSAVSGQRLRRQKVRIEGPCNLIDLPIGRLGVATVALLQLLIVFWMIACEQRGKVNDNRLRLDLA